MLRDFPSYPSYCHVFKKYFLSKSETEVEVEEICCKSIRKKDWRPVEYSPSYIPDQDPDNQLPIKEKFFFFTVLDGMVTSVKLMAAATC